MTRQFPLKILHKYFLGSVVLFLLVEGFKLLSVSAPSWLYSHLNDFLCIPIVATLCLHVVWIIKKDRSIRLGTFDILSLVILFSVYFEYYLPQKSSRYTGDIWDVVCYAGGGLVFYALQKIEV